MYVGGLQYAGAGDEGPPLLEPAGKQRVRALDAAASRGTSDPRVRTRGDQDPVVARGARPRPGETASLWPQGARFVGDEDYSSTQVARLDRSRLGRSGSRTTDRTVDRMEPPRTHARRKRTPYLRVTFTPPAPTLCRDERPSETPHTPCTVGVTTHSTLLALCL